MTQRKIESLTPDLPEVNKYESLHNEEFGELEIEEYRGMDEVVAIVRSEALEGLLGFNQEEITERLDEVYGEDFSGTDLDCIEYGNGWALFRREE